MLSLEQLKECKGYDVIQKFYEAMKENYSGGDTLIVKNIELRPVGEEYGLKTEVKNQWFTATELEFIERENILDKIRADGWKIDIQRHLGGEFVEIEWLFTGGGPIKLF